MGALRPLAICRDYGEMHAAFREYVEELNITRATINHAAGFQDGYCEKLLGPGHIKNFGVMSLGAFMGATGLVLIVAQDLDALAKIRHRLPDSVRNRQIRQARTA
jgi:hypothetical protein